MKPAIFLALFLLGTAPAPLRAQTPAPAQVETLVCFRHAEKPKAGLGQLTPRGLKRALALPAVLIGKFGKPAFIFAPNPARKIQDVNGRYDYVRPLATVEPTAIACGLPVNADIGQADVSTLRRTLLNRPEYRNARVFVCWEHHNLVAFARDVVKELGGNAAQVPDWPRPDFDSIYVIRIVRHGHAASVSFSIAHEGLNNL